MYPLMDSKERESLESEEDSNLFVPVIKGRANFQVIRQALIQILKKS